MCACTCAGAQKCRKQGYWATRNVDALHLQMDSSGQGYMMDATVKYKQFAYKPGKGNCKQPPSLKSAKALLPSILRGNKLFSKVSNR